MNKLDHVVTKNIKVKDQCNDAIAYEPKFYNTFILYSESSKYYLPVVTVILIGWKKNRANINSRITCLWDSGYVSP